MCLTGRQPLSLLSDCLMHYRYNNPTFKVWHLETAQVICSFDYMLRNVQVTSKNTFLVGISYDGKLNAISLWMGMLAKVNKANSFT